MSADQCLPVTQAQKAWTVVHAFFRARTARLRAQARLNFLQVAQYLYSLHIFL